MLEPWKEPPVDHQAARKRPNVFAIPGMTYEQPFGQPHSGMTEKQTKDPVEFLLAKLGTNGDLVRAVERVSARMATAVMRATDADIGQPTAELSSLLVRSGDESLKGVDDSTLLETQVLRLIGRTKFYHPSMQGAVPHNHGEDAGMMRYLNMMHAPFMQWLLYTIQPAEKAGIGYIHGDIDLETSSDKMRHASVQERNHAISAMVKQGSYEIVKKDGDSKYVVGTVPEGLLKGEPIELKLISLSEFSKNVKIGDASLATLATGHAQRPEGRVYGSVAHQVVVADGDYDKPLGHIIHSETGKTLDQLTLAKMAALEIIRKKTFVSSPADHQRQLALLCLGGTFRPVEGSLQLEDIKSQIDTSKAGKFNQEDGWTTAMELMHGFQELAGNGYNPVPPMEMVLKKTQASMNKDEEHKNCLLTSALVSQMLEVLYPDRVFPEAYENARLSPATMANYRMTLEKVATPVEGPHCHKNIASFYKLTDKNGQCMSDGPDGKPLPLPEMNEKSLAVILSSAVIVVESMITQYLVQGALLHPDDEYLSTLRRIEGALGAPGLTDQLLAHGQDILKSGDKFGRQHASNKPMLDLLRQEGSPGRRIIDALHDGTLEEQVKNNPEMIDAILKLREVGVILQETQSLTARHRYSNGLPAGLDAIIAKLHPDLMEGLTKAEPVDILAGHREHFRPAQVTHEELALPSPVRHAAV